MTPKSLVSIVTVSIFVTFAMSGCVSEPVEKSCDEAIAEVPPIEPLPGMSPVVSLELAMTLDRCESVEEWTTTLRNHPDVVGVSHISEDEALTYLGGSCQLLETETSASNDVCREAVGLGLVIQ